MVDITAQQGHVQNSVTLSFEHYGLNRLREQKQKHARISHNIIRTNMHQEKACMGSSTRSTPTA
jgi:hypothetical protein